jgi:predicted metal-binding membrane protein
MMAGMMLPSLTPLLWRYIKSIAPTGVARSACLTMLMTAGYFFVWTVLGLAIFVAGAGFAALAMQSTDLARAAPALASLAVMSGGALQLTSWKAHRLARCREIPSCGCQTPADSISAWRYGLRLGLQCSYCCAGFTAILLAIGVMDLRAMAVVTIAISLERLLPIGERVARATGVVVVAVGLIMTLGTIPASAVTLKHIF